MRHNSKNSVFKTFSLISVLKSSTKFIMSYKKTFMVLCLINYVLLFMLSIIPNGWRNSLSIIWLVIYYIYFCVFIRYIQQREPYFSLIRIFNGLIPVSKIMFINISIFLLSIITQYIPLLMGFQDKYLEFFEKYMGILQSYNGLPEKTLLYFMMAMLSPYTISRPYLAWLSSQIGKTRSIRDAYKKTQGNYWKFMISFVVMSIPFVISFYIDTIYELKTKVIVTSILTVYFNIVFLNIYKIFYQRKQQKLKQA